MRVKANTIRQKTVKKRKVKTSISTKAPESLYGITVIFLILFLWQISKIVINPVGVHFLYLAGLSIGLIVCVRKLLQQGIRIEKVPSLEKVYYSLSTYILLALAVPFLAAIVSDPLAKALRASKGLPPFTSEGLEALGVTLLSMLCLGINVTYALVSLIIGASHGSTRLKRILFNVGIILIVLSCLLVSAAYVNLVVSAPADGYPKWNF